MLGWDDGEANCGTWLTLQVPLGFAKIGYGPLFRPGRAVGATELSIIQSKHAEGRLNSPVRRTQSSEIHFPVQKGQSIFPGIFPEGAGFPSYPASAGTHPCF